MDWKRVAVAGSGVLGSQIAFQAAYKGYHVTIWLFNETSRQATISKLQDLQKQYLQELEAMKLDRHAFCRGLLHSPDYSIQDIEWSINQVESCMKNIYLTTDYHEAFSQADIVIESIVEIPQAKINFYENIAAILPSHTLIGTNSSTLLPSQFAEYTGRADKYMSLHFANEIWRNNIAEIMGHDTTSPQAFQQMIEFAQSISMIPIPIYKEKSGYILNSLLVPFLRSALSLYANGISSPEVIDAAWTKGTSAVKGPFEILDIVSLPTAYSIVTLDKDSHNPESDAYKIAAKLKEKIDLGHTGRNAGQGFYQYSSTK